MNTLWIGVGGAIGTIARYHMDGWVQKMLGPSLPYGTLTVNLLGSFLLAFLMGMSWRSEVLSPNLRVVLATGVLGGFTTYSAFNFETLRYLQGEGWGMAALNVAATVLGCLAASALGWSAGKGILGG